jgi:hypothetical protein
MYIPDYNKMWIDKPMGYDRVDIYWVSGTAKQRVFAKPIDFVFEAYQPAETIEPFFRMESFEAKNFLKLITDVAIEAGIVKVPVSPEVPNLLGKQEVLREWLEYMKSKEEKR